MTATVQYAHAAGADWRTVAAKCAPMLGEARSGRLGFLYVTEPLATDLPKLLAFFRERTGVRHWTGAVGAGICATGVEYFDDPAVAALTIDLPDGAHHMLPELTDGDGGLDHAAARWLEDNPAPFGIVHADPRNQAVFHLIPRLAAQTGGYLVGGLTSANVEPALIADRPTAGALSGALLSPRVTVATGLTQGCMPIGPPHAVTASHDNILLQLDGRPALEVLKEDIGELLARDLKRVGGYVHAAIPVAGSDTGDYLVRNLTGIDTEKGWVAVGAALGAGDQVMFVRRDTASAIGDLERMLDKLIGRAGDTPPKAGIYFSCVARGPNQFGTDSEELRIIQDKIGDVPLVGFFGNGEISHDRLYSYTGILSLFL